MRVVPKASLKFGRTTAIRASHGVNLGLGVAHGRQTARMKSSTSFATAYAPKRVVNLSAGCAALPEEVLERAAREMNSPLGKEISITEMGYRTGDFHEIIDKSEENFRTLMNVPDNYDVHFFNGGMQLHPILPYSYSHFAAFLLSLSLYLSLIITHILIISPPLPLYSL